MYEDIKKNKIKTGIIVSIFIFVVACAGMAIRVFISYPVQVGESRIYLESRKYKKTKVQKL